jgi:eukaryotic-like serine/threonine-protein kinase
MDPGRWREIQAAFDALVELDPAARASRLETLGSSDPELRAAVESLLGADAEVDSRLAEVESAFHSIATPALDLLGLAGRTVSHFRILQPLGAGGMAVVYHAEDTRLGRPVALKFLLPHFGLDASAKERFLREARCAAALDHPNLCTVHEVGESRDGRLFIAMTLYRGETLKARLAREGSLPVNDALAIAKQIVEGLSCAHGAGIVHRDLKPGNVMVLPDGTVKILDFGLAKTRDQNVSSASTRVGTAAYMAPEQVRGEGVDGRTDLWALGVVLYEMTTGRRPFVEEYDVAIARRILEKAPDPPTKLRADVPAEVEHVILTLLEKEPFGRFANAHAVLAALTTPVRARGLRTRRWARRLLAGGAVTVAIGWLTLGIVRTLTVANLQLDANLVAVAPFDVLDPKLELWHEGLVDVLSRNLDGAGPLRTVSPTVVVHRWEGRADPASATALGHRTGARLVTFGQLLPVGVDSVRLTATLYDVARQTQVLEIEVHDLEARMDRVTDSLTIAILRDLGSTRTIGAARLSSLGSTSLPAIKAFLRAEQFYRRGTYDSTLVYARHALGIDSNFTLALRLIPRVSWATGADSATVYWLREGARNHGLAPRESLLVVVDSLWGATFLNPTASLLRRFYAMLEDAVRRYPEDPEFWEERGELGFHRSNPYTVPLTTTQTLASFQRAIQLDSAYASAYDHAVELALREGAPALARRYLRAQVAGDLIPAHASGARLIGMLLETGKTESSETSKMIDTVSPDALIWAWERVKTWPDSIEEAVRLARLIPAPPRDRVGQFASAYSGLGWVLPLTLAYRGHLHEANSELSESKYYESRAVLLTESARVGAVSHDSAAEAFRALLPLTNNDSWLIAASGWWAMTGDSASIHAFARKADRLARAAIAPADRSSWKYEALAARPYLALARHDTAAAIAELTSLPDSLCPPCYFEPLQLSELLAARGRLQEAAALLDRELYPPSRLEAPSRGIWMLLRGRVNERLGRREEAIAAYRFVADLWIHADPELQRYVAQAREGLRRLGAQSES